LGIELGLWQGSYQIKPNSGCAGGMSKNLLLIGDERAALGTSRKGRAGTKGCYPRLLGMGLRVEQVAEALGFSVDEVVVLQKNREGGKVESLCSKEKTAHG